MSTNERTNISVRKARREDMKEVYALLKGLAEFENLLDQVKIDEHTLERDGFDTDNPLFGCFVAEMSDGPLVGYALYFHSYSTWEGASILLEDIYVHPDYRKNGVGKQLFLAVARAAKDMDMKRIDFHVLSWNPAVDFYKKMGAVNLTQKEDWNLFRLDHESINALFP
ncbi:unnamed protein product [Phaedon cochleariae]|uniref:N-acetyltransferase domain-containing protein n=1 Tax=Phaedon cochleariae TaxID=80249 RepID=A0A9N9SJI9_PHACE|nr:unnamed protein product [Phaedon cochleariae]